MLIVLSHKGLGWLVIQQKLTDTEIIRESIKAAVTFHTINVQNWKRVKKYNRRKDPIYNSNISTNLPENKLNQK